MKKRSAYTEETIQRGCVEFLTRFVPAPPDGPAWTAVNPIPAKSKAAAGVSKAMGLKAGVHDIVMCWEGAFLGFEIKTPKGRVSPAQKMWHGALEAAGGHSFVIRDVADFAYILRNLGVPIRGKRADVGAAA